MASRLELTDALVFPMFEWLRFGVWTARQKQKKFSLSNAPTVSGVRRGTLGVPKIARGFLFWSLVDEWSQRLPDTRLVSVDAASEGVLPLLRLARSMM